MSTETDQAAARKAQDLYRFDGSDPDMILALRSAFRAGAEFAAERAPAPAPSVVPEAARTPPVERIEGTWLVEVTDEHTCGGGPGSGTGMHEPGCGLVPVVDLATLPGWDEHLTAAPSATREEVARAIRSVTDHWDEPLDEVHDVPPIADALLARFTITPKEDR